MNLSSEDKDMLRLRTLRDIQASKEYTETNVEFFSKFFRENLKETSSTLKLLAGVDQKYKELMIDIKIHDTNKGDMIYSKGQSIYNIYSVYKGTILSRRKGIEARREELNDIERSGAQYYT